MPSKSKKQAKLMRAVAHGWKKPGGGGPTQAVAKEFANADRRKKVSGYAFGGITGPMMNGGATGRFGARQNVRRPQKSAGLQHDPRRSGPKVQQRRPVGPARGALGQVNQHMNRNRAVQKPPNGRRIAPPPGKFPGGGNPNTGRRNPMIRQANNRRPSTMRGRGATSCLR